jgi:hypothetical protein
MEFYGSGHVFGSTAGVVNANYISEAYVHWGFLEVFLSAI